MCCSGSSRFIAQLIRCYAAPLESTRCHAIAKLVVSSLCRCDARRLDSHRRLAVASRFASRPCLALALLVASVRCCSQSLLIRAVPLLCILCPAIALPLCAIPLRRACLPGDSMPLPLPSLQRVALASRCLSGRFDAVACLLNAISVRVRSSLGLAVAIRVNATPSLRIRFAALPLLRQFVHRHAVAVPRSSLPRLAVSHRFQSPPCRFRAGQCPAAPLRFHVILCRGKSGQSAAVSKLISSVPILCRAGLGCDMQCLCQSALIPSPQCPCAAYLGYSVAHTACQ